MTFAQSLKKMKYYYSEKNYSKEIPVLIQTAVCSPEEPL